MRIRQVKPEFFKDGLIAGLSPVARLSYIGLWMLADDAGWFRLDVPAIALEVFGYEPRARREKVVSRVLEELVAAGRVVPHKCGHAQVPTLIHHQRFAGETKRVYTIKREHASCPPLPAGGGGEPPPMLGPADARGSPPAPATVRLGQVRSGTVRKGQSNARRRDETESEFRLRVKPEFLGGER
jgi:hypothetical protein